ncbi:hypothetical protein DY000_02037295 [Brassica cretica]|uniref:Uncharacterized protein n=1 Tax=Brassica cretica TaxID=69181 RepID=A0ABQ7B6A3_BRACR|nr:hypothetical protein DY000_02037295 [Brassica cretica]
MYQNHPPAENVDKPSSRYHPPPQPFTTQESQPPSPEKKAKTLETKAGRPSRVTTRRRRQNRPTTEEKSASPETKTDLENSLISTPCERLNLGTKKSHLKALTDLSRYRSGGRWIDLDVRNTGLTLTGGGTFDRQGAVAWPFNNCKLLPASLKFVGMNRTIVRRISSVNSKFFHIALVECRDFKGTTRKFSDYNHKYQMWTRSWYQEPSKVKLSEIYFKNIRGTSSSRVAVQLRCSKGMPYKKVYLENVYLYLSSSRGGSGEKQTSNRGSEAVSSFCRYVIAKYIGTQSPPPCH